ncbi:MAG TPA: response regulator transcription factor [Myxococcota bacterium]|nr:response regulator transcription factor [Myxococcota bacterium]
MESILVVEDDPSIAKGLDQNLRYEGFSVFVAKDGERGLELAVDKQPDLILLDVMLPKLNGFEVLREIRRRQLEMPVIMLTAKGEQLDKVRGLDMGADDYVTKPFGLPELLARIQAVLRRKRRHEKSVEQASFGNVRVDFSARAVWVADVPVTLTTRELDLLRFFMSREGTALERQEILNRVWGFDYFGTDRTVDNFINRLRQKLEADPENPRHFQTVRGIGYRFSGDG